MKCSNDMVGDLTFAVVGFVAEVSGATGGVVAAVPGVGVRVGWAVGVVHHGWALSAGRVGGRDVRQFAVWLVCGIATLGPDEADGRLAPCLVGLVDVQFAFVWAVAGGVRREATRVAGGQCSDINLRGFFNGLSLLDCRVDDGFRLWGSSS